MGGREGVRVGQQRGREVDGRAFGGVFWTEGGSLPSSVLHPTNSAPETARLVVFEDNSRIEYLPFPIRSNHSTKGGKGKRVERLSARFGLVLRVFQFTGFLVSDAISTITRDTIFLAQFYHLGRDRSSSKVICRLRRGVQPRVARIRTLRF